MCGPRASRRETRATVNVAGRTCVRCASAARSRLECRLSPNGSALGASRRRRPLQQPLAIAETIAKSRVSAQTSFAFPQSASEVVHGVRFTAGRAALGGECTTMPILRRFRVEQPVSPRVAEDDATTYGPDSDGVIAAGRHSASAPAGIAGGRGAEAFGPDRARRSGRRDGRIGEASRTTPRCHRYPLPQRREGVALSAGD